MMTDTRTSTNAPLLWIALFTVAATLTTLIFHCATPFPSLAALAAIHLKRRDGVLLMVAAWTVSQTVGFCFMGYPWDGATALTGFAVGTAAVLGVLAAGAVDAPLRGTQVAVRLVVAYLAAFAAFKLTIAGWSPIMGHADAALSLTVMLRQFVRYAAVLAGIYAIYRALIAAGVPALPTVRRPLAA